MIIIVNPNRENNRYNRYVIIVNFRNPFDKALTKKACNAWPYSSLQMRVNETFYFREQIQKKNIPYSKIFFRAEFQ